jgi:hypothetical protein
VDALHPTPAVAGQPKEEAICFIKQLEPHDRAYYTGFLGPLDREAGTMDLFREPALHEALHSGLDGALCGRRDHPGF